MTTDLDGEFMIYPSPSADGREAVFILKNVVSNMFYNEFDSHSIIINFSVGFETS